MEQSNLRTAAIVAGTVIFATIVATIGFLLARPDGADVTTSSLSTTTSTSSSTSAPTSFRPIAVDTTTSTTTTLPQPQEFPDLFENLRNAVANVDVVGCDFVSQGTAFMVDDDVAYTAWHVVDGAAQIALDVGGESIEATVIGRDIERDVAVLKLSTPVENATVIELSTSDPRVGEEVAAMGHPRGLPLALTVGRVTSMNGDFDFGSNLIQTDAVVAPGSSGGPLINDFGEVVGIVVLKDIAAEGLMYASDIDGVRTDLLGWTENPEPVRSSFCVGSVELDDIDQIAPELIAADTEHSEIAALQRTFAVYSQSINSGRAEDAFGVLGPAITTNNSADAWAEGQRTSLLWDWRIREVVEVGDALQVRSSFTSTQEAEFGFDGSSTCTRWDITHDLIRGDFRDRDFWLINRSTATAGAGPVDCLEWTPEVVPQEQLVLPGVGEGLSRAGYLAGGTVHDWDIGLGPLPEDADPTPVTLVVSVDAADERFDPVITIRDEFGGVIAENDDRDDGTLNSQVDIEVNSYAVLSVEVGDLSNRSGGEYVITFSNAAG